ncbi:hypothetical protein [Streptomyces geranii]|uniref:hypothetical protein n=1 Tax=Streptomyces geranii TaxID=2058923 RepID=UPI000D02487D|nr:hypothetical protein [Streptomyces geranii]
MPGKNESPHGTGNLTETFAFRCLDCATTWNRTFEVIPLPDPAGCLNPLEYVDEDGRAMRTPLTDAVCAACGSRKVRVG